MTVEPTRQPPSRPRGRDGLHVRAWRAILEVQARLLPVFEAEMQEAAGVGLDTYDALIHTWEAGEDGIRMTDLSHQLVVSKSGLTALVDRLEAQGLLRRIPDPADRRAVRVAVTDEGYQLFRKAAKAHMAGIERHFAAHISPEEAQTILDVVDRIRPAAD